MTDPLLDRLLAAVGTQYLVDAEIGRGGMAVVYRARDLRLHRDVAIKLLPPDLAFKPDVRERFLREAQTAAQLTHPNIVPIYTVDEKDGMVYFVMALVEGESLAERLVRESRLPVTEARTILAAVADALAYAHSRGVVHRDVKPDNIMLERTTGRPMVTDFGIARAGESDARLTVTGVAIGTPAYMSPEQATGEREIDGRSDIYSLGVIAYQLLAGEPPFKAGNTPAMLMKHLSETPRPLGPLRPDAPSSLVHAIARALAKKPDDRWADANEFRDALSGARDAAPYADRGAHPRHAPAAVSVPVWDGYSDSPLRIAGRPGPPRVPLSLPAPVMPSGGSRADWRQWRREQKEWERARKDEAKRLSGAGDHDDPTLPMEVRLSTFRRKTIGSAVTIASLAAVNIITNVDFLWFLFPAAFMTMGIISRGGHLWADGVPLGRLFARGTPRLVGQEGSTAALPASAGPDLALALAPADVLAGAHGDAVRRAAGDQRAAHETLARLAPAERDMIPDVGPTVDALATRVGGLAATLHRLDADVGGASVGVLDARVGALRAEAGDAPTAEQERRIALLERQRATILELVSRRSALASQLESASLTLQNLRFDLLKLRSSALGTAMSDVAHATREARAMSRDIGHAVDALNEVKRM